MTTKTAKTTKPFRITRARFNALCAVGDGNFDSHNTRFSAAASSLSAAGLITFDHAARRYLLTVEGRRRLERYEVRKAAAEALLDCPDDSPLKSQLAADYARAVRASEAD